MIVYVRWTINGSRVNVKVRIKVNPYINPNRDLDLNEIAHRYLMIPQILQSCEVYSYIRSENDYPITSRQATPRGK